MTNDFDLPAYLHKLVMDASVQVHPEGSAKRCWIVYRWEVFDLMKKAYSEGLKAEVSGEETRPERELIDPD